MGSKWFIHGAKHHEENQLLGFHPFWSSLVYCVNLLLTHWGRVTHICASKKTIIGSDNGLAPGRRHAIIWTNVEILLIGTLGTNFSEMLIEIRIFSFKKMGLKVPSAKCRPFYRGLSVLRWSTVTCQTHRSKKRKWTDISFGGG